MRYLFILLGIMNLCPLWGQELSTEETKHTFIFGFPKVHSAGTIGGDIQYQRKNEKWNTFINLSINAIKHPKELRYRSSIPESNSFILGKINYLVILQPTYGLQKPLIKTSFLNQVNIEAGFGIGPSIAFIKPYYLDIYVTQVNGNPVTPYTSQEVYDPQRHNASNIYGASGFTVGFNKASLKLGVGMRAQIQADITDQRRFLKGIIFGVQSDFYPKPILMMAEAKNYQTFHALFLGLLLGNRW